MSSETTYALIKDIFLLLDDGDRQLLSQFGLTVPRFYALFHLGNIPGLSPNNLSDLLLCDKSNVTRLIKGMEIDGLVVRRRHESDGRSIRLYLTNKGQMIREQAMQAHEGFTALRFDGEVMQQESRLPDLLRRLKASLEVKLERVDEFTA